MDELVGIMSRGSAAQRSLAWTFKQPTIKEFVYGPVRFSPEGGAFRETTSKDRFRRALLLMKPAHTGHHPGAVPGFRPSPGNSEETTTRVLTEEISVLFRVPTWDPTHPGSPVSRALPGNRPETRGAPEINLPLRGAENTSKHKQTQVAHRQSTHTNLTS